VIPSLYLNCTNTFTGQNNYTTFIAGISMVSTTNIGHLAAGASVKNVTWSEPAPDNNSSSDWAIYVGVSVGVVVLGVIGFIVFRKIQRRRQDNYERM
jgi:hypothetical protein